MMEVLRELLAAYWQAVMTGVLVLAGAAALLCWVRRRRRPAAVPGRSQGQVPAAAQVRRPAPPAPRQSWDFSQSGIDCGEFSGKILARRLWDTYNPGHERGHEPLWKLWNYLRQNVHKELSGEPVYLHPCVQAGSLIECGTEARQAENQLYWRLHEQSFEFVAATSGGRILGAFDILDKGHPNFRSRHQQGTGRSRQKSEALTNQDLKREACRAVNLYYDTVYANFIEENWSQVLTFLDEAIRAKNEGVIPGKAKTALSESAQNFMRALYLSTESVFSRQHDEAAFFYCLQKAARRRRAAVHCQTDLKCLVRGLIEVRIKGRLKIRLPEDIYKKIRYLSLDFVVTDRNGDTVAAVELDGASHADRKSRSNDDIKNRALAAAGIKLVRVTRRDNDKYDDEKLQDILERILFDEQGLHYKVQYGCAQS